MEEIVEILNEDGKKTQNSISKLEAHKKGICHGISAVGIINEDGKILIQKRYKTKKDEPNKWDLSSAGHIDIGEDSIQAALRELHEELGIKFNINDLELIDTYLNKKRLTSDIFINHFTYLYIIRKNIDINNFIIRKDEVSEIKYVNKQEYCELINNDEMVEGIKYCGEILKYIK